MTDTPCWPFTGYISRKGYGQCRYDGAVMHAHRAVWMETFGPIPEGLWVLHRCDNRKCVNPEHLFLGTNDDNVKDKVSKGRQSRLPGSANGCARLTEDDIPVIRELCARGCPQRDVAAVFGVSQPMISLIVRREKWAHVP